MTAHAKLWVTKYFGPLAPADIRTVPPVSAPPPASFAEPIRHGLALGAEVYGGKSGALGDREDDMNLKEFWIEYHADPLELQSIWMCERHDELLEAYQKAVALFSTTLDALQAARALVVKHEYERMRNYVEQTRLISEDARMDLERHVAEHGCDSMANVAT